MRFITEVNKTGEQPLRRMLNSYPGEITSRFVPEMPDFNLLSEFSRDHCIAVCAVLVPANLLATLQTMLFVWFGRPIAQVYSITAAASLYALLIILHVITWLAIGVVMLPTYILSVLGCVCLLINFSALLIATHRSRTIQPELMAERLV